MTKQRESGLGEWEVQVIDAIIHASNKASFKAVKVK